MSTNAPPPPAAPAGARPAVAMVVRNAVSHDTRVLREASALAAAGYAVTIFGMRLRDTDEIDERDGVRIVRITPNSRLAIFLARWTGRIRRWDRRVRSIRRRLLRKVRAIVARARRQWELLAAPGTVAGAFAALAEALRTPRRAVITVPLFPVALVRALVRKPEPRALPAGFADAPLGADLVIDAPSEPSPAPVDVASSDPAATHPAPLDPPQAEQAPAVATPPTRPAYNGIIRRVTARADRARLHATRLAFQTQAARAMAELRPVAYHCHDFNTLYAGYRAAKLWRAPVVYDSHEIYLHRNLATHARYGKQVFGVVERLLIKRAAVVITVNQSIAEYLAKTYRVAVPAVIRNVPDSAPPVGEVEVPSAFSWPGTKVLYLGGITLGRGIEQAIAAMRYLPDAALIAMGPVVRDQYLDTFREMAKASGAGDRIFFVPAVPPEHIEQIVHHASVGLSVLLNQSLNNYYSLPNKLFSYIQGGVPVVASDFPELRRVVVEHGVGRVCDPEDPKALAEAISSMVDDPETYARYRAAAKEASAIFTWERESERLLEIYRGIDANGPASHRSAPAER